MTDSPGHSGLPEPSDPFSRWFGGACVAAWAVGVQSFPDPLNKLLAILSPGVGYLAGHTMNQAVKANDRRAQLKGVRDSIALIEEELETLLQRNASEESVNRCEELLDLARAKKAEILSNAVLGILVKTSHRATTRVIASPSGVDTQSSG